MGEGQNGLPAARMSCQAGGYQDEQQQVSEARGGTAIRASKLSGEVQSLQKLSDR